MNTPWRIQLFGGLLASQGDTRLTRFRTRKAASLLAYLAYRLGEPVSRETLIDAIWPELPADSARNNLSVSLNSLRRQLEPPRVPRGAILQTTRTQVCLLPDAVETDVQEFLKLLRDETQSVTPERLERAAEIYRGPFAPEILEAWAAEARERLSEAYLRALGQLVRHYSAIREFGRALPYASRALAADPLRESAHRTLIRLQLALGRPVEAREQYQRMEALLREELRAEPSERSRALLAEIPQTSIVTASKPEGRANLSSSAKAHEPPTEPPDPPKKLRTQTGSLPLRFTRFFGREAELEWLTERLVPTRPTRTPQLVTITGPGGIGKSRLSIEAASAMRESFGGRIWFVPLADLRDPEHLLSATARVLDLPLLGKSSALEQIADYLHGSPSLLVLDNLEQLGGAGANIVQILRERAPETSLLATSRRPLDLPGESVFELASLPLPEVQEELYQTAQTPAVALFIDRAQARLSDFQITPRNCGDIAQLCVRLEGIPLAIELAAARIGYLTPRQMTDSVEERFRLLESRGEDRPERHRSLWAAIDWSYQLLSPELRRLFATLSVFRGGWTAEDASFICLGGEALDSIEPLSRLRSHSLVSFGLAGDVGRYQLYDSLREFGEEQLSASEWNALRRRHFERFLSRAEAAKGDFDGGHARVRIAEADLEIDNYRAALEWAIDAREGRACQLAAALWRYWDRTGRYQEGSEWLRKVVTTFEELDPPSFLDTVLGLGAMETATGNYAEAEERLRAACERIRAEGDATRLGSALILLAHPIDSRTKTAEAEALYREALALSPESADPLAAAHAYTGLGNVHLVRAELAEARRCYEEALTVFERNGLPGTATKVFNNLGIVARDEQRYDEALSLFRRALEITEIVPNPMGSCTILNSIGLILTYQSRHDEAVAPLEESLRVARQIGYPFGAALALRNIGLSRSLAGDIEGSRAALSECLQIRRRLEDYRGIASALAGFSNLAFLEGRHGETVQLLAAARALRKRFYVALDKPSIAEEDEMLEACCTQMGDASFVSALSRGECLDIESACALALKHECL